MSAPQDETAPLAESARRFVDAARPHERLSAERKAHLRGRVMAAVGAGVAATVGASAAKAAEIGAGAGAGAGTAAGAGSAAGTAVGVAGTGALKVAGLSLFAKIGLSVAVATIGVGGVLWSRAQAPADAAHDARPAITATASDPAANGSSRDRDVPPALSADPFKRTPDPSTEPAQTPLPGDPSGTSATAKGATSGAAARPAASGEAAPAAEPVDSLTEENKLLAAAHAELSRGNAGAALAILDEHAARFPRGTLAPERRATRAMALCKAGRTEEGRRELVALYGGDSKSPMAQKIDRACGK
jgi:hypothetical protein